ncbi:glycosyltransferase family 2 protein [Dyella choica]|uniref:Glycosyltransferase n=1 Tax=Dyella choica TaxID=1927959 RepID=A0A432M8K1_9GAMM|nr:glycosyltransferase family 2 protein [Dyella choica]RUL76744.1 glycosyltransferase [Dyella choica]
MGSVPAVSVITVVYNAASCIEKCLRSVAEQQGVAYEHIVIDGGSTDGTVDILRRHAEKLAFWCSEPDAGIADAMNKGVARATGKWIIFIHADDGLAGPDVLAKATASIPESADIVAFPVLFGTPGSQRVIRPKPVKSRMRLKLGMCHQGMLARRRLFDKIGGFNVDLRICMDYEHVLRAISAGCAVSVFEEPVISWMSDAGLSSRNDWRSVRTRLLEEKRVNEKYAQSRLLRRILRVYWQLYLPYRRLRAWIHDTGST